MARSERRPALARLFGPLQPPAGRVERDRPGVGLTLGLEAQRQLLSNVLNAPDALVRLANQAQLGNIGRTTLGQEPTAPPVDLSVDPDRIFAGMRAAARVASEGLGEEALGDLFQQELENVRSEREARQAEHPAAGELGTIGGDVATLLIGRAPFARLRQAIPALRAREAGLEPGFRRAAVRLLNHPTTQSIFRGVGRAGEAGLEGAALAILDRSDPLETAAYAAGMQVGGSLSLEALKHIRRRPGIAATVYLGASVLQMLKEATPGGKDFILESIEASARKAAIVIGLGMLSGLAGKGRIGGDFAKDFPRLADAITAIPRNSLNSLAKELARDDTPEETELVLETFTQDPDFFGPAARDRLSRAIRDPSRTLTAEVNRLMRSREFRTRVDAARETLATALPPPAAAEAPAPATAAPGGRIRLRERILGAEAPALSPRSRTRIPLRDRILSTEAR